MYIFFGIVTGIFYVLLAILLFCLSRNIRNTNKERRTNRMSGNTINYSEMAHDIFEIARMDLMFKESTGDYETRIYEEGPFVHTVSRTVETEVYVKYNSRFSRPNSSVTTKWEVDSADDFEKLCLEVKKLAKFTGIKVQGGASFGIATIYFTRKF